MAACYDADCEVELSTPTDIPVDPAYGVSTVSLVEVGPDSVTLRAVGPGIELGSTVGPGGPAP